MKKLFGLVWMLPTNKSLIPSKKEYYSGVFQQLFNGRKVKEF